MFKSIKRRMEYRRNKRIITEELFGMLAVGIPKISYLIYKTADICDAITEVVDEIGGADGGKVLDLVVEKAIEVLNLDKTRTVEVLKYLSRLTPDEIQMIINSVSTDENTEGVDKN